MVESRLQGQASLGEDPRAVDHPDAWRANGAVLGADGDRFVPLPAREVAHRQGRALEVEIPLVRAGRFCECNDEDPILPADHAAEAMASISLEGVTRLFERRGGRSRSHPAHPRRATDGHRRTLGMRQDHGPADDCRT